MPKIIVVEKAVDVGAKNPARCINGAVGSGPGNSVTLDRYERASSYIVKSFSDMYLVAVETRLRRRIQAEDFRKQPAANPAHGFVRMKDSSHGQKTESFSAAWFAVIFDPVGICNRIAEHLKTAADADYRNAAFMELPERIHETAAIEPLQVVK